MTDAKVTKSSNKAHKLDESAQTLRDSARKKWNKAIICASVAFFMLFSIAVITLLQVQSSVKTQNRLAYQNKNHIDCIIKLSETPLPPNERAKFISNLNNTCQIKFVK